MFTLELHSTIYDTLLYRCTQDARQSLQVTIKLGTSHFITDINVFLSSNTK